MPFPFLEWVLKIRKRSLQNSLHSHFRPKAKGLLHLSKPFGFQNDSWLRGHDLNVRPSGYERLGQKPNLVCLVSLPKVPAQLSYFYLSPILYPKQRGLKSIPNSTPVTQPAIVYLV